MNSPLTICCHPGCNRITEGGRCEQHAQQQHRGTSKNRSGDPFYCSKAWLRLRDWKRMDQPLCEECLNHGIVKAMQHVDHIKPRRDYPELELDADNLRSLCESCHVTAIASDAKIVA